MTVAKLTREQESSLYRFLRLRLEGDSLRYELIAKKVQRLADGTANDWEASIAMDWLSAMNEEMSGKLLEQSGSVETATSEPFAQVRTGKVGNPNYQAFLDTLEQHELNAITNNVPYFSWIMKRQAEATQLGVAGLEYLRKWADENLSNRVKAEMAIG